VQWAFTKNETRNAISCPSSFPNRNLMANVARAASSADKPSSDSSSTVVLSNPLASNSPPPRLPPEPEEEEREDVVAEPVTFAPETTYVEQQQHQHQHPAQFAHEHQLQHEHHPANRYLQQEQQHQQCAPPVPQQQRILEPHVVTIHKTETGEDVHSLWQRKTIFLFRYDSNKSESFCYFARDRI
jgi:hypothetical protein